MPELSRKQIIKRARQAIEEGEKWHSKVNMREIVFGFNDGTVSTLALLAGVTGGNLTLLGVLIAGFAGVIGGAISMAVGAYISSKSEIEHHRAVIETERNEVKEFPKVEEEELRQLYQKKAKFTKQELDMIVGRIMVDEKTWVDTMMREELGLFEEHFEHPVKVGLIMFAAFLVGGTLPVFPFFLVSAPDNGLVFASVVTFVSLFIVGVWKTRFTGRSKVFSGSEMVVMGVIATVVPYLVGDVLISRILAGIL
jgi:VIT1/CCC1 family predicted Fe2+/Mn2+ transporter